MRGVATATMFLVAVAAVALSSACAAVRVRSFTDPTISLQAYRTYAWDVSGPGATGDPRLDNNRFFRERIVAAVDRELSRRSFERALIGRPQLIVHLHARVDQKIDTAALDRHDTACGDGDCPVTVFDEGTVLLDVLDAGTDRLLWRGWSESSFDGVVDDQDWMDETIDRLVGTIFGDFPAPADTAARRQ